MKTKEEILALINSEYGFDYGFDYELDSSNSDSNIRCVACKICNACQDCYHCIKSTRCIDCEYCEMCVDCIGCANCINLHNCINCKNLGDTNDCFGHSKKIKYMIDNHQFSKTQYEIFKKKYLEAIAAKYSWDSLKERKLNLAIHRLIRFTNE